MKLRRLAAVGLAAVIVSGCGIVTVEQAPVAGAVPTGPVRALGGEATGPVTVIGTGRSMGIGWRYAAYASGTSMCTQLEMSAVSTAGCGDPFPADGAVFGGVGQSSGSNGGPTSVEGVVSDAVAEVWIRADGGEDYPTTVMSLEPAGFHGQAFVGFVPAGTAPRSVTAADADGEVMESRPLD